MPELPEVETIRRQLAPLVQGRRIARIEVLDPRWSRPVAPAELEAALEGRLIESLDRRGKYLLWHLEGDVHLAQHLRMTGAILAEPDPEPAHTRVRIELSSRERPARAAPSAGARNGGRYRSDGAGARPLRLVVADPRRFGTGELLLGTAALDGFLAARLGLEPFDEAFTGAHLHALARGRTAPIKAFLLDQRRIAGVGNIYADEALYRARIHPRRPAGRLTRDQHDRLRDTIVAALNAGIDARGASIDDYRDIDGVKGSFQDRFLVHRREGEPCPECGGPIKKLVVAGRGTYVCETCQPRPRPRPRPRRAGSAGR